MENNTINGLPAIEWGMEQAESSRKAGFKQGLKLGIPVGIIISLGILYGYMELSKRNIIK